MKFAFYFLRIIEISLLKKILKTKW